MFCIDNLAITNACMFAIKMIVDNLAACCCFHYIPVVGRIFQDFDLTVRFKPSNFVIATYYFFVTVGELI